MKKLLPIFISVFIVIVNILSANAADNVLRSVAVKKDSNSYTIELTSTMPARMTKSIVSANRVIINLKNIEISPNISTQKANQYIDNVMVEPYGDSNVNILVQGENVAYSNVNFKAPSTFESIEDNIKSSFLSLGNLFNGNSTNNRGFQIGILFVLFSAIIAEICFIKTKFNELKKEKEEMMKNIKRTNDFKDYLPGYEKKGLTKPYTTPLYTGYVNTSVSNKTTLRKFNTPETLTLNSLLKNKNQETKIIDKIINNKPVFGTLSNININDNTPISTTPKTKKITNPLEKAKLKSNIRHLEELTALYRNNANFENSEKIIRERLNKIY